jgi:serine-type D-Ala-D-Ala carboxypeptidase/endopeptidase (penicillin-binding protein 4)
MIATMIRRHHGLAIVFALPALTACATRRTPVATITPRDFGRFADSIINSPPLDRGHIGIEVYDPATRRVLYEHNGQRHFIPASNQKLWVSSTALHELGPDYRYRTPVLAVGEDGAGGARAVVVRGRGDPTMSARFHGEDHAALGMLADSIVRAGIRRITGDLIIDASWFDRAVIPGTWTFGNLNGTSAPGTGAFVTAEGIFSMIVRPGAQSGEPAVVEATAARAAVPLSARVTTVAAGGQSSTSLSRGPWDDTVRVTGRVVAGANPSTLRMPMSDPTRFAAHVLADALRARGVAIDGRVVVVYDSAEARAIRDGIIADQRLGVREITAWSSPPMRDIVAAILGPSQNWIAEQVLRTLGAERRGTGSWNAGIAVETKFLYDVVGIDSAAVRPSDGSGMSNYNLVTPHAVVQLFEYARTAPWAPVFRAALAKPGQPGTLSTRLRNLEGRLEGKTGTLNSVNALSGYVRTVDGRELIFSMIGNASGLGGAPVTTAMDKLVNALAEGWLPR